MAIVDVNQISKALNLTPRRVQQLKKEGMPSAGRGLYDPGPCMLWYIRYLQKAIENRSSGEDGDVTSLMAERTKQARAQAERTQMINLKARREVLLAEEVRQQVLMAIAYLGQDLNAVAQRVTTDEAIQAKVEDELRLARDRFADHLSALAARIGPVGGSGRSGKAKAKANAGRVGGRDADSASGDAGAGTLAQ